MSYDYFHGAHSYGSINNTYDVPSYWATNEGPSVAAPSATRRSNGRSEGESTYDGPEDANYDEEDSFLYHNLSGRDSAVAVATPDGNSNSSLLADNSRYLTPYYSSGNDGRSGREQTHEGDGDDVVRTSPGNGRASSMLICWNLLNLLLGTGILAFPFAVHSGGVIVFGVSVAVATAAYYTGRLLISCLYETRVDDHGLEYSVKVRCDYVELGQDAFNSVVGGSVVHILQSAEMIAVCVLNLIVLGELCHEVFPSLGIRMCTLVGAAFSFPTVFIRKIQVVAWMQLAGIISLGIALILIEGWCLANASSWQVKSIPIYDIENLSIASGIIIYSFGIHPVLPGIENHMRHPEKYGIVLLFTFVLTCLIQYLFGFTNAALYSANTRQLITIDLKHHFNLGIASAAFVFLSIVCCFALPTFVVMERIDNNLLAVLPWFGRGTKRHFTLAVMVRLFIIGVSLVVAVLVPYFAYVMGFVGCSISSLLSFILPCIFHLKIKAGNIRWYEYVADFAVIFFGVFIMAVGMYHTVKAAS